MEEAKRDILPILLAAGADLNAQTIEGETPLMTSVLYKYPMMFHLLMKEGATIQCQFKPEVAPLYCRTVFELALFINFPEAVRILFNAGVDNSVLDHLEQAENIQITLNEDEDEGELKQVIEEIQSERPRRLKILCRKTIRDALGHKIQENITKTGLPQVLSDYVLMVKELKEAEEFIYGDYEEYTGNSDDEYDWYMTAPDKEIYPDSD